MVKKCSGMFGHCFCWVPVKILVFFLGFIGQQKNLEIDEKTHTFNDDGMFDLQEKSRPRNMGEYQVILKEPIRTAAWIFQEQPLPSLQGTSYKWNYIALFHPSYRSYGTLLTSSTGMSMVLSK